jgi:hypothetical protein
MPEAPPPPEPPPAPGYLPPPPLYPPAGWGVAPGGYGAPGYGQPPPGFMPYGWIPAQGPVGSGRFRAMSLGELLDAVFSLYRRNFLLIAAISAVVQVPYAVISTALLELTGAYTFISRSSTFTVTPGQQTLSPEQVQQFVGLSVVEVVLALLTTLVVLPLAIAATTRAVSDRYLDNETSLGASYRAAFARFGALMWQSFLLFAGAVGLLVALSGVVLLGVLLGPAGILLTLAGIVGAVVVLLMVYVRTSLAAPAIVLEHLSGWDGLKRSWNLVHGHSWRIFGIRLLIVLITAIISGIVATLLSLAGSGLDSNGQFLVTEVAGAFASVFVSPITYIAVTLLYYDTRIRKEGFDIEMLARSL